MRGQLITVLGINNIGKSTQADFLEQRIKANGGEVVSVKYPAYQLGKTGPMINAYLREGNPDGLSPREFQLLNALNRTQREGMIRQFLSEGRHVVAEDYTGTGIAWGIGTGVDKDFLLRINKHLFIEDIAILLDGKPFDKAEERSHKHENDRARIAKVRDIHRELAHEFGWHVVDANRLASEVCDDIWKIVEPKILL